MAAGDRQFLIALARSSAGLAFYAGFEKSFGWPDFILKLCAEASVVAGRD